MLIRDGSFFTKDAKSHIDARVAPTCQWCGVADTRDHKYSACARYDEARGTFLELFRRWDDLPSCFRNYGLVPGNVWESFLWEAFLHIPSDLEVFTMLPSGDVWRVFTDGRCSSLSRHGEALASWAAVWADKGVISSGN